MVFVRPSDVPFPQVWWRFTVVRNGVSIPLRVQDITEDQVEPAIQMLMENFTRDEPPCKYIEINKHPTAVAELVKLWSDTIKHKMSVVCVEDKEDHPQMVGVNVLTVICKEDKEEPFHTEDPVWAQLFGAVELVSNSVDVFSHYGVDKYLTAYGLVVAKGWRGLKIGAEILRARVPLCKAFGIKATVTVFTAAASQAVATKAGFEDLHETTYEELAKKGCVFPGIERDTKSSKLMGLAID
ncbi:unnamed protein product [Chilo suppressalis]|uniref:N-acetyltransferase domain-containing protein n=1 Tax=Chilo suppressalis TaxID=168631 RepID=A0ABN8LFC2_CHISP|nr:unnamed protein product [Chilo suppressalis]